MPTSDHSNRDHALLSASGAHRWLNCPPSARLETKFDESRPSVFAEEGTLAHELAEIMLRFSLKEIDQKTYNSSYKTIVKSKIYSPDMDSYVGQYVDQVLEALAFVKKVDPDAFILIEKRLDYSHWVEGGYGTGDAVIVSSVSILVFDLKYGRGIKVSAEGNPQLRLYGLAALHEFELDYDIKTVSLNIVQPRLGNVSTSKEHPEDLKLWADKEVKPAAKLAFAGEGLQKAGSWCKFCKVQALCGTLSAANAKLAENDFKDPHLLSEKQLLKVRSMIPMLVDWANSVEAYLLQEALKGKKWPGLKVVEGQSKRRWKSEEEVKEALELEYDPTDYLNQKLKSITDIQKLVGKENFKKDFTSLIIRPQGAPVLVPETDEMPALGIDSAREDFKNN